MPVLNQVAAADTYTATKARLSDVWNSRGGWFSVLTNPAYVQMQYGELGDGHYVDEILLGIGAFAFIPPNCIGVQFRNAVAGSPAIVTAQIAQGDEPALAISALGQTPVTVAALNFQKNDVAVATEPTIDFGDNTSLAWTVTDDPANTRVKVSAALVYPLPGTPTAPTPATADNSTKVATTAYVQAQNYVTAVTAPVTSVDGRTGAVTGLADLTSASAQVFSGAVSTGPASGAYNGAQVNGVFVNTGGQISTFNAATFLGFSCGLTTDTVAKLTISSTGTVAWGPGNAATDTTLARVTQTSLGNASGSVTGLHVAATSGAFLLADGGLYSGSSADAPIANAGTWTPDLSQGNFASATMATAGATTMTIAAPVNRPTGSHSMYITLRIHNSAGSGGVTITWNAAFAASTSVALPTSVTFGKFAWVSFVWDSTGGFWVPISVVTQ